MVIGVALRGIGKIIKSQGRKNRRKRLGLPAETYLQRQKSFDQLSKIYLN